MSEQEDFRNTSEFVFRDISSEEYREYIYPNGTRIKIDHPIRLSIAPQHGHRIWDGVRSWWIRPTFLVIIWKAKEGAPHFAF